jgi:hypothetical protein
LQETGQAASCAPPVTPSPIRKFKRVAGFGEAFGFKARLGKVDAGFPSGPRENKEIEHFR